MPLWGWLLFAAACVAIPLSGGRVARAWTRFRLERSIRRNMVNRVDHIHLFLPGAPPPWRRPVEVQATADTLRGAGLADVGLFCVRELDGVSLWLWIHPAERFYAAITQFPNEWHLDLIAWFEDGRHETYSTLSSEGGARRPPSAPIRHFPGATAAELLARFRAECARDGRTAVGYGDPPLLYERHWAEYAHWRRSHPPDAEEIAAVIAWREKQKTAPPTSS